MIAPAGSVYQAGTLSGNPLAMTAGIETLRVIAEDDNFYDRLEERSKYLENGIRDAMQELNLNYTLNRCGSMFTLFFTEQPVTDFTSAKTSDTTKFVSFFNQMLEAGVYLPPSQFEACFVSAAHDQDVLDATIEKARRALESI